jgi:uncharacterized repeat protein (TIGR03803 family)
VTANCICGYKIFNHNHANVGRKIIRFKTYFVFLCYINPALMKKHVLTVIIILITTAWSNAQSVNLWGMASSGGQDTSGVIFKVTSAGALTAEYSFKDYYSGDTDGQNPSGSLLEANDGLLYGLTGRSSYSNYGAIFSYNTSTAVEKVLDFFNGYNGAYPAGTFIQSTNGLLYGTTSGEGAYDAGTVITYDISTGVTTDIYDFEDDTDGNTPLGALYQANDGLLYGLTSSGGTNYGGEIFGIDPTNNNAYSVLYNFQYNDTDGVRPYGSLIQAKNDLLYGLAVTGGTNFASYGGTIFSYNIATHKEKTVWSFGANDDGSTPYGSLIQAKGNDSLLFGLTNGGDSNTDGTIFSFNINTGLEQTLHIFALDGHEGFFPEGSLVQASDGKLYGTTSSGGANNAGTIFSYDISADTEITIASFDGTNGSHPYGDLIELLTTGINQLSVNTNQLSVYPNPCSDLIYVSFSQRQAQSVQLSLYNMLGQEVYSTTPTLSHANPTTITIPVTNVPTGIYVLKVNGGNFTQQREIIVAR